MSNFITKEFEPVSSAGWKQKIQVDLKGADYNETLLTETVEGITIKPFYHSDQFEKLNIPGLKEDFKIAQYITVTHEKEDGLKAVKLVTKGIDALVFNADNPFHIELLLNKLLDKNLDFHFNLNFFDIQFINDLLLFLKNEKVYLNLDALGQFCKTGNWFNSLNNDLGQMKDLITGNPSKNVLGIDLSIYQSAGASCVQQVAYALAHLNEYLNRFDSLKEIKLQLNLTIGSHYFFEIAKIRALRYLIVQLLDEYHLKNEFTIFAKPGIRNKTIYDYNVNLLRTSSESMSAILGGANTIANQSYDHLFHESNDFGERIARNQLLILREESNFIGAHDFATDSYYIESITRQIAEKALAIFKEIEAGGGFISQLMKGTVQRKIKESANKEQQLFDSSELVLLGSNKYPNEQDKMKDELIKNPFPLPRPSKTLIEPILPKRLASVYEQNRLKNEA